MVKTLISIGLVGLATTTACKWTEFDELAEQTWVHSTERPNSISKNWGVAIQRASASGAGGTIAVVGASEAMFTEVRYSPVGGVEIPAEVGVSAGSLPTEPILLAEPGSDNVALVVPAGGGATVLRGTRDMLTEHPVPGPATVDGATYMQPASGPPGVLVGYASSVFGVVFAAPPGTAPRACMLTDATGNAIRIAALGTWRNGTADDVIVWGADGLLYRFATTVFDTCASPAATEVSAKATMVLPPVEDLDYDGAQIVSFQIGTRQLAVLQTADSDNGYLAVVDLDNLTIISERAEPLIRTVSSVFELDGAFFVAAGYPTDTVEGVIAGTVRVFAIDETTGIATSPAMQLYDAEPESGQLFGRSIAIVPFNNMPTIAVGASNEVFMYFRTALYEDTRDR